MNTVTEWILSEFFQTSRDYILHLQNLNILLISAAIFLLYQHRDLKWVKLWLIIIAILFSIAGLAIGLFSYREMISTIMAFTFEPDKVDIISGIRCSIYAQFFMLILALIFVGIFTLNIGKEPRSD